MPSFIQKIINKSVDKRINEILKARDHFNFREISDYEAKNEIKKFILEQQKIGNATLSLLDFVLTLKIPATQVQRILEEYESQNKIKEISYA